MILSERLSFFPKSTITVIATSSVKPLASVAELALLAGMACFHLVSCREIWVSWLGHEREGNESTAALGAIYHLDAVRCC